MKYKDKLVDLCVTYLNREGNEQDAQTLYSSDPRSNESKKEIITKTIAAIKKEISN